MGDNVNTEAEYAFNEHCMLAGVICELLSVRERTIAQAWILKLKAIRDPSQFRLRLEYINYLMYCIAKNCMVYPFNRVPFDRPLQPLEDVVINTLTAVCIHLDTHHSRALPLEKIDRGSQSVNIWSCISMYLQPKEQFVRDKTMEPSENDDLPRDLDPDLEAPDVPAARPLWPGEFIKRNPIPKSGVMCYMAAFGE